MQNNKQRADDFIDGAEWVIKHLGNIQGGAARIVNAHLFPVKDLLQQAKSGKIDHVWKMGGNHAE